MADIASISAVLASVKTATDLAKLIKNSEISLADAETKLKIAELIAALADVKLELSEVQEVLREKDQEIKKLIEKLENKDAMKFDGKLYWMEGDETPFCPVCFEGNDKNHHLGYSARSTHYPAFHFCKICKNNFYENA